MTTRMTAKSVPLASCLMVWLYLISLIRNTNSAMLAKPGSTHPSFPLDAFSSPAYKVIYLNNDPINNHTAIQLLRAGKEGLSDELSKGLARYGITANGEEEEEDESKPESNQNHNPAPFHAYLHRSSKDSLHVCTLSKNTQSSHQNLQQLDDTNIQQYRSNVLRRALQLLAPLRQKCLYHHPEDWFSYSFCYGDAIRQFHAVSGTIGAGKVPSIDTSQDSFILGRWRDSIEHIHGEVGREDDEHQQSTIGEFSSDERQDEGNEIEQGSELMQLIHFSSIEEDISRSQAELKDSFEVQGKGRYISQTWTDGTICKLNHEARTTEVQYHCAKTPAYDRITLIKEVTTCNYVIVIETPRLCDEPALAQKEDHVKEVHCRPILSDAELHERYMNNIRDTHASLLEGAKKDESLTESNELVDDGKEDELIKESQLKTSDDGKKNDVASTLSEQLTKIIEKIAAEKKSEMGGDGVIVEDIQVVVGMDERGEVILDTNRNGFGSLAEQFLKATKKKGKNEEEDEDEDEEGYELPDDETDSKTRASEQWQKILEKMKDFKGTTATSDGVVYQVMQDPTNTDGHSDDLMDGNDVSNEEMPQTQANGMQPGSVVQNGIKNQAQNQQQGAARRPHGQPQRGNMMVREPETFAQRAERHFKAQEEMEKKMNQAQESKNEEKKRKGENFGERKHDEL